MSLSPSVSQSLSLALPCFLACKKYSSVLLWKRVESKETVQESSRVRKQRQKRNSLCAEESGGEKKKESIIEWCRQQQQKKKENWWERNKETDKERERERERWHDTTRHERWQGQLRAAGVNPHGSFLTVHSSPFSATFSHSDAQP